MDVEEIGFEEIEAEVGDPRKRDWAKKAAILVGAAILCIVVLAVAVSANGLQGNDAAERPDTERALKSVPMKTKPATDEAKTSSSDESGEEAGERGGSLKAAGLSGSESELAESSGSSSASGSVTPLVPTPSPS